MSARWFYTRDGKHRHGPFTDRQMRDFALQGALLPTDRIWREGAPKWQQARTVDGLFDPPPVTLPLTELMPAPSIPVEPAVDLQVPDIPVPPVPPSRASSAPPGHPPPLEAEGAQDILGVLGVAFGGLSVIASLFSCLYPPFVLGCLPMSFICLWSAALSKGPRRNVGMCLGLAPWAVMVLVLMASALFGILLSFLSERGRG